MLVIKVQNVTVFMNKECFMLTCSYVRYIYFFIQCCINTMPEHFRLSANFDILAVLSSKRTISTQKYEFGPKISLGSSVKFVFKQLLFEALSIQK